MKFPISQISRLVLNLAVLTSCLACGGMFVQLEAAASPIGNQTIVFGSLTPARAGGAQAQAADGNYVNFETIIGGVSGDTNNWIISGGRLVSTVALAGRSTAVLRCSARNFEFNVTIQIDPGAADVASPQEFLTVFTTGDHGGQRFYFRPATDFNMASINTYGRIGGQSSEVIFDCRDPQHKARLNCFPMGMPTGTPLENLTFQNLHFIDTQAAMRAANRTIMLGFGASPVNQPFARNITIENCVFELDLGYGRLGDKPYASGDVYAISFRSFAENIIIRRNEIINHGLAIVFGNGCRDTLVEENICRLAWNDFLRFCYTDVSNPLTVFPDTERVRVAFNAIYDPVADNEVRHVDTVQTFQNNVYGNPGVIGDIELIGNLSFIGAEGVRQTPPLYPTEQAILKPVFADYTVPASDFLGENEASVRIDVDTTSGPVTVTLPNMNTVSRYTRLYVAKVSPDSNAVTVVDPSGVFGTVILSKQWDKNSYTKKGDVNTVSSVRGVAVLRKINSDCLVAVDDFNVGVTAWKVDTSSGPVVLSLPDMGAAPVGKFMTVVKISGDNNPVILRMAEPGQVIYLRRAIDGTVESVTEYQLKAQWSGAYMSKQDGQAINVSASSPNLAGFRIQRFYRGGTTLPYAGMAVVGNLMYTTDLLYRPESAVDNLVLAYNTGILNYSGDVNGDGSVDIHDGYNPSSPEIEWYSVTGGIRRPEAFGNIGQTFSKYSGSPANGIDLGAGNLQTRGYSDAQIEALYDVAHATDMFPKTVQEAIGLSRTKSTGAGAAYGVHQLIDFSTWADGRGLTGTFKDNSAPAAPTASASIAGDTAVITITPNGTNAVHEYGSRVWYLVDGVASHTYEEITGLGESRYVRGSVDEIVTVPIPASGACYLHMARRSINTQKAVSSPVQLR